MTIGKSFLVCALAAGLCVAGSAQAFCFLKGNNNNARGLNYYNQPLPPLAFAPSRYYAYPHSMLPAGTQPVQPTYPYMQQESNLLNGAPDRR